MSVVKTRKPTDQSENYLWSKNVVEHPKNENISEATQKQKETSVEIKQKKAHMRKVEKNKLLQGLTEETPICQPGLRKRCIK